MSEEKGFGGTFDKVPQKNKNQGNEQQQPVVKDETVESLKKKLEEKEQELAAAKASSQMPTPTLFTQDQVEGMVAKALLNQTNLLRSVASPVVAPEDEEPPIDDYDENGTDFFCFRVIHVIAGDFRRGRSVLPPKWGTNAERMIIFETLFANPIKKGSSKQEEVLIVSRFTSKSKTLTNWLREHSEYNISFFENVSTKMDSANVRHAQALASTFAWAKSLDPGAVAKECRNLGIAVSMNNTDAMRAALAEAKVAQMFTRLPDGRLVENNGYASQSVRMSSMSIEDLNDAKSLKTQMENTPNATWSSDISEADRIAAIKNRPEKD